jgi:DNA-directed RNA polymerase specialized sigma24 family protein
MKEQEDISLIQNISEGSLEAQETLYNKYTKIVGDFIKKKYSIYYDIDDDVSEIMIKVIMGIDSYDQTKAKFKSWVLSIAKNHMIDKWRCTSVAFTTSNCSGTFTVSTDNLVCAESVSGFITSTNTCGMVDGNTFISSNCADIEIDNCSSVNYITNQLSAVDATLLDMKYVQGYNYDEIGSEFNLTSSTVSNRVNYIKSKLKKNNSEIIYD